MAGGFLSPLWFLGLGAIPGFASPATILDDSHIWRVTVNGADFTQYIKGMITTTEPEAGEIGTMHVTFQALGSALNANLTEWKEVILYADGDPYFGGYAVSITDAIDQDQPDGWQTYDVVVEGYATLLNRTPPIRRSYKTTVYTPGDIVADMFDYALDPAGSPPAQTEFDTSTYVTAGSWSDEAAFLVDGEAITDALDTLALIFGYTWWIDASKRVHFGLASSAPAPFEIADIMTADYSTSFPPLSRPTKRSDGSDIRNRVTVHGGVRALEHTDNLTGDGSTLMFQLSYFPVFDIISIVVDEVLQSWGTDWYDTFDDYDVLVDYQCGTIRWDAGNAPANLAEIRVIFVYGDPVTVTVHNGTGGGSSYATYGRWFDFEIIDRAITSLALATTIAQAVVDEYEFAAVAATLTVERLGIRPGQELTVYFPALGLDDNYPVRQVITEVSRGGVARCEVSFGGRRRTLQLGLIGNQQAGPMARSTQWTEHRVNRSLDRPGAKISRSVMQSTGPTQSNQPAANTNTPSGATARQWPIYDLSGALLGYVPVYGSAW